MTPWILRVLVPIPEIFAPNLLRKRHNFWTWGSLAELWIMEWPLARQAAMTAFSVAVTEASSRSISAAWKYLGSEKKYP